MSSGLPLPVGNHEDQGASARDKVRVELEEVTDGFDQSSVPKPDAKTSNIAISSCSRHCAQKSLTVCYSDRRRPRRPAPINNLSAYLSSSQ